MRRVLLTFLASVCASSALALVPASPAWAVNAQHDRIVSATPAGGTPQVQDGQVNAIVEVGDTIVVGGQFTQVRQPGGAILNRTNLFAFDKSSGVISDTFAPNPNAPVLGLATDGTSVFVGGSFGTINGGTVAKRIAKLDVSTGLPVAGFNVNVDSGAAVYDLAVANGRVYIGGAFSTINGTARQRLAALDVTTGALDPGFNFTITQKHNGGTLRVHKLDVSPDGQKLVAIGNFVLVNGLDRRQIVMIDLSTSPDTVANWQTDRFKASCAALFDTYMRDVDFSPDGSYFVIATTGAFVGGVNAGVLCDTVTRWESNATGSGRQPTWADYTGGDTTFSVASTGAAIYVGGHQRWWNNPFRGDAAGPGAVSRPGIAALDPINGLPFSWNPVREPRGTGVFALVATSQGLWFGSDTCDIAGVQRCRMGLMPLEGGTFVPPDVQFSLPNDLFQIPATGGAQFITRRSFTGSAFGPVSNLNTPGTDWTQARGTFITNGKLYSGWSNGQFLSRTFDGTNVGPAVAVNLNGLTSTQFPITNVTGMFFTSGRLYYTVSGDARLFYRYFTPESDVVGAVTFVASGAGDGLNWSLARGMTLANGRIYFARTDNNLRRMNFSNGVPVPGTEALISGPSTGDGRTWSSRDLFIAGSTVDNFPPTAPGKPTGTSVTQDSIDLTWAASVDSTSTSLTYEIYRDGGAQPVGSVVSSSTTTVSFTDPGLTAGDTHMYVVTAKDAAQNVSTSPQSDPIQVLTPDTTPPSVPGTPTGAADGSTRIDLTWGASTDDRSTTLTYRVYRDGETDPVGTLSSNSTTSVSFTDTGLEPGSTHTYVVTAEDEATNVSTSGASAPITTVAAIFSDAFSNGLSDWTTVTRLTIDNARGGLAPPSARGDVTSQSAWAAKDFDDTYPSICASISINVQATDGTALDLLRLRTPGNGALAKVLLSAGGVLQFRSDVSGVVRGTGTTLPAGWNSIELCGTVGTSGTWDMYLNGSKILDAWVADTGTTPVGRLQIGNSTAKTFTVNFDDVLVDQQPG